MDEIDAALDFKNVSIVANYIKDRTKDAQFIIISLREFILNQKIIIIEFWLTFSPPSPTPRYPLGNNMFELADRLVGIYKTEDVTKSVTINPKAIAAVCGLAQAADTMGLGGGGGGGGGGGVPNGL
jgi:structural maintenance of chromosome 4